MSKPSKFHTRFDPPSGRGVSASEGGLTDQHFKDECDLNSILKRYRATGIPPPAGGSFIDTTLIPKSLDEAFDVVSTAVDWFAALPSDVREKFGNDPRTALRLVQTDPASAIACGLLPESRQAAKAANPEPASPAKPEPAKPAQPEPAKPEPAKA